MGATGDSGEESRVNWKLGREVGLLPRGAIRCSSTWHGAGGSACARREKELNMLVASVLRVVLCSLCQGGQRDLSDFARCY